MNLLAGLKRVRWMDSKMACFPFIDGNLQIYSDFDLNDNEREKVYNGEKVEFELHYRNKVEEWKPLTKVKMKLRYIGYINEDGVVGFICEDDNKHHYPMLINDFDNMIRQCDSVLSVNGVFTYVKRGKYYGIKLLTLSKD